MKDTISIHCGAYGIGVADCLYTRQLAEFGEEAAPKPKAILVDTDASQIHQQMLHGESRHLLDFNYFIAG
jgi:hypothetical protein